MSGNTLWPADLVPYKVGFYLQNHVGGSESPFSRATKTYGLSAPRFVARYMIRGGYDGIRDQEGFGPRLDGLLAEMEGTARVRLWDFRRPHSIRPQIRSSAAPLATPGALKGATQMTVIGFAPRAFAFSVGDYIGGDGRAHLVTRPVLADGAGRALVTFRPPLSADVPAGPVPVSQVTSPFRLARASADDAGANETEVGQLTVYTLDFVEDFNDAA